MSCHLLTLYKKKQEKEICLHCQKLVSVTGGLNIQREIRPKKISGSEVFSLCEKRMPGYKEKVFIKRRCTLGLFFLRLLVEACVSI